MWSSTFPFVEGHLLPSGAWFQNTDGPKRFQLWCRSSQFPVLCTSSSLLSVVIGDFSEVYSFEYYCSVKNKVQQFCSISPLPVWFFLISKRSWWYYFYKSKGFRTTFRRRLIFQKGKYLHSPYLTSLEKVWVGLGISEHKKRPWEQNVDSHLPRKVALCCTYYWQWALSTPSKICLKHIWERESDSYLTMLHGY